MMNLTEFIITLIGWIMSGILLVFVFVMMFFTPAWKFLRSKMKRVPLFLTKYKDTFGDFELGSKPKAECSKIKGAPIHITEGSQIIESKSKVPIYIRFSGHGINTNMEYAAIVQELHTMGIGIDRIEDLTHIIRLTTDNEYKQQYLESIPDPKNKQTETELIDKLRTMEISIQPHKTYTIPDLKNLFPFNINSDFVDGITEEEVNLALKRQKNRDDLKKWMMIGAIAFAIIMGILIIFFMVVDIPEKKIVCDCAGAGVRVISNLTI